MLPTICCWMHMAVDSPREIKNTTPNRRSHHSHCPCIPC